MAIDTKELRAAAKGAMPAIRPLILEAADEIDRLRGEEIRYGLLVYKSMEKALLFNVFIENFWERKSPFVHLRATFVGQSICGLNYRGQRPNVVIYAGKPIGERELAWWDDILVPCVAKNALWLDVSELVEVER